MTHTTKLRCSCTRSSGRRVRGRSGKTGICSCAHTGPSILRAARGGRILRRALPAIQRRSQTGIFGRGGTAPFPYHHGRRGSAQATVVVRERRGSPTAEDACLRSPLDGG